MEKQFKKSLAIASLSVIYLSVFHCGFLELSFFENLFIYLVVVGLPRCTRALSSRSEQGLLFIGVHRLLTDVTFLVAEHGL